MFSLGFIYDVFSVYSIYARTSNQFAEINKLVYPYKLLPEAFSNKGKSFSLSM